MEPIDLQTVIVRGVDAATQVSNETNQALLIQHHLSARQAEQIRRETTQVTTPRNVDQKTVRTSTEGGGQHTFYSGSRREGGSRKKRSSMDDFRGHILDVRL
ncbi:MAG: hypothetical protein DRP27_00385 [Thermotogae bacterium]|nr:MAG: hypothetical protein DRP27_00385 [Thermotogota bacterium]